MIANYETEQLVHEIQDLVKSVETAKDDVSIFCELMKQIYLTGSTKN